MLVASQLRALVCRRGDDLKDNTKKMSKQREFAVQSLGIVGDVSPLIWRRLDCTVPIYSDSNRPPTFPTHCLCKFLAALLSRTPEKGKAYEGECRRGRCLRKIDKIIRLMKRNHSANENDGDLPSLRLLPTNFQGDMLLCMWSTDCLFTEQFEHNNQVVVPTSAGEQHCGRFTTT
ncbi:hypothetical protein THAOC_16832 [Thalassiosira oceanica]|uniref:Uncharacterized protein n=1 Tax=Thalassiosira oceanica TaxID=159749 RepID=K0SW90_THAOC|nr:hypothetical protein THAOC_16832 [Thalassiosira oceanica]|eukprot:EJK62552.1 hypothetical protein THAOC_16832 [Thalassiosira oceanica]